MKVTQEICKDPQVIADAREKYDLIPDMPPELVSQIASYYKEAIDAGVYSCTGGSPKDAETDIQVFSAAGQLTGDDLTVDKFWDFGPLQAVQKNLGIDPMAAKPAAGGG